VEGEGEAERVGVGAGVDGDARGGRWVLSASPEPSGSTPEPGTVRGGYTVLVITAWTPNQDSVTAAVVASVQEAA
jgi:hypothetical protein